MYTCTHTLSHTHTSFLFGLQCLTLAWNNHNPTHRTGCSGLLLAWCICSSFCLLAGLVLLSTHQKAFCGDGKLGNSRNSNFSYLCLLNWRTDLSLCTSCCIKNPGESSREKNEIKSINVSKANSSHFGNIFSKVVENPASQSCRGLAKLGLNPSSHILSLYIHVCVCAYCIQRMPSNVKHLNYV